MFDYVAGLFGFVGAARLAVHRGDLDEANRQLTRAMRARPSCTFALPFLAVRARLQLAKAYWSLADHTTAHHLLREIDDVLLHRPALGVLVDQVEELRRLLSAGASAAATGASPLTPAELRLLPYLQTHLTIARGGRPAVRVPQHGEHPGRRDLSQAGRLVTQRGGGAGDRDRTARRLAGITRHAYASRASSVSYPRASASLGAAATTQGSPTTGTTPTSTSTISATVAPALTAASACSP